MKIILAAALSLLLAQSGFAAPLQLKNRLVFTRGTLTSHDETVWTMNPDGGEQKRVWRVPQGYGRFGGFSRDGKLALSFNAFNLYVHELRTRRIRKVLEWNNGFGTSILQPSFSPNGKQILCEVADSQQNWANQRLMRLQVGNSRSKLEDLKATIIHPIGEGAPDAQWSEPRWGVNGKQILALGGQLDVLSAQPRAGLDLEIWIMNADGTGAQRLTHNTDWDSAPSMSPDGKKIVFARAPDVKPDQRHFVSNLYVLNLADKTEKSLTSNVYDPFRNVDIEIQSPLFSPDGNRIAFGQITRQMRGGERWSAPEIYRIDADNTHQKRLADGHLVQWIS